MKFLVNAFGIPKLQYGFSNNARGEFGPVIFEKALFKIADPNMNMQISVN
ncbi:MAG: DUF2141 domain-containing protein [Candidatus Obscuribacterales bacterium]|nr:DUF2141 domain-containing protein [Candidatus Obscuribacterales bacterium]